MVFGKRSQAAMEFLMTYGWAILVVLAAIGGLTYFGVLNPLRFLPESCTLSSTSGMSCLDFVLTPTSAHLLISNSGGRDYIISNVTLGDCVNSFGLDFPDGSSHLFNITGCDFGSAGSKIKLNLALHYTDRISDFEKEASGSITSVLH